MMFDFAFRPRTRKTKIFRTFPSWATLIHLSKTVLPVWGLEKKIIFEYCVLSDCMSSNKISIWTIAKLYEIKFIFHRKSFFGLVWFMVIVIFLFKCVQKNPTNRFNICLDKHFLTVNILKSLHRWRLFAVSQFHPSLGNLFIPGRMMDVEIIDLMFYCLGKHFGLITINVHCDNIN